LHRRDALRDQQSRTLDKFDSCDVRAFSLYDQLTKSITAVHPGLAIWSASWLASNGKHPEEGARGGAPGASRGEQAHLTYDLSHGMMPKLGHNNPDDWAPLFARELRKVSAQRSSRAFRIWSKIVDQEIKRIYKAIENSEGDARTDNAIASAVIDGVLADVRAYEKTETYPTALITATDGRPLPESGRQ
jgi:hypothetical protein